MTHIRNMMADIAHASHHLDWKELKQSAMTLLDELKAHFGNLAKSKRDTAQRLYSQLGGNKDVTAPEQKKLIKLLEDADQRLGETLQPFMKTTQENLEKKLDN